MTHNEYVLQALRRGPLTRSQLLHGAYAELGEGIEVHCRLSEVRQRLLPAETITKTLVPGRKRQEYLYEIVVVAPVQLVLSEDAA